MGLRELNFNGLTLADAAAISGESQTDTRKWLENHGYSVRPERIMFLTHPHIIQDALAERIAAAPPSGPCWRCGARYGCGHR